MLAGRPPLVRSLLNMRAMPRTSCCCPRSRSMRSGSWPRSRRRWSGIISALSPCRRGIKGPDGEFLSASGLKDSFGHSQLGGVAPLISNLITTKLGCKCHWAVPDYLLRSARHIASETDLQQAYAVGRAAVEFAIAGRTAVMPAIRRLSDTPYRWDIIEAPLSEVANQEKLLPPDFISGDGFGITEAARRYLAPLIVGEAYPPFKNGLPDY